MDDLHLTLLLVQSKDCLSALMQLTYNLKNRGETARFRRKTNSEDAKEQELRQSSLDAATEIYVFSLSFSCGIVEDLLLEKKRFFSAALSGEIMHLASDMSRLLWILLSQCECSHWSELILEEFSTSICNKKFRWSERS